MPSSQALLPGALEHISHQGTCWAHEGAGGGEKIGLINLRVMKALNTSYSLENFSAQRFFFTGSNSKIVERGLQHIVLSLRHFCSICQLYFILFLWRLETLTWLRELYCTCWLVEIQEQKAPKITLAVSYTQIEFSGFSSPPEFYYADFSTGLLIAPICYGGFEEARYEDELALAVFQSLINPLMPNRSNCTYT